MRLPVPSVFRKQLLTVVLILGSFTLPVHGGETPFVDSLLSTLSAAEKAGQMILVYRSPYAFLRENHVGGVLIMQNMVKNNDSLRRWVRSVQRRLPIPLLVTIDQEGGAVNRLTSRSGWRSTPSAWELSSWSPDSIRAYARNTGSELSRLGINVNLAPVLDPAVNHTNRSTFMAAMNRSFGNGATSIAAVARPFVEGCSEQGVFCVAKHFPGYDVESNSDFDTAYSSADSATLAGYVEAFQAISEHAAGIMMSSIHYRSICDTPAVFSGAMVAWARRTVGDDIIMTDDLWGTSLRSFMLPGMQPNARTYPDSAFGRMVECAVRAGNDMLMITYPGKVPLMIRTITDLAGRDPRVAASVDSSVRRILLAKEKTGLFPRRSVKTGQSAR
jgi:beta-N-acetylhexosaminidase